MISVKLLHGVCNRKDPYSRFRVGRVQSELASNQRDAEFGFKVFFPFGCASKRGHRRGKLAGCKT